MTRAEFGAVEAVPLPEAMQLAVEHRALGPQAAVLVVVGVGGRGFGHDRAFGVGWRGGVRASALALRGCLRQHLRMRAERAASVPQDEG